MAGRARRTGIVLAVAAALVLAAWWGLPRLARPDRHRAAAEQALSSAIGRPVRMAPLSLSLGFGVVVRSETVTVDPDGDVAASGDAPAVFHDVRLRLAPLALLRGRFDVRGVRFRDGAIGGGRRPLLAGMTLDAGVAVGDDGTVRCEGRSAWRVPAVAGLPADLTFAAMLLGGRVEVPAVEGWFGPARVVGSGSVQGIGAGVVSSTWTVRVLQDGSPAEADLQVDVGAGEPGRPYRLGARVERLRLGPWIDAIRPDLAGAVDGRALVAIDLAGRDGEAPSGTARIVVDDGRLAGIPILDQIARALAAASEQDATTAFDELSATFRVRDDVAHTDDLILRSRDLSLDGAGQVDSDGRVDLAVVATLSGPVSDGLVRQVPALRFRMGPDGRVSLPLTVGGTLDAPEVAVDVGRVLEEGLGKGLRDRLREMFGR